MQRRILLMSALFILGTKAIAGIDTLRIPMNSNEDSDLIRMEIPVQFERSFRFNSNGDSDPIRTRIEEEAMLNLKLV